MDYNKKPSITKAGNEKETEKNWFSKSEIARMTGRIKPKRFDSEKIKSKIANTSSVTSAQAKKHLIKAKKSSKTIPGQIKRYKGKFDQFTPRTKLATLGVVLVLGISGSYVLTKNEGTSFTEVSSTDLLGAQVAQDVDFEVLEPSEGSVDASRFDAERKIFQFEGAINGEKVVVSQQPLPDDMKNNSFNLQKIALSVPEAEAVNRYEVGGLGLVHIANQTGGGQTVIFSYQDSLLVFITSDTTFPADQWIEYINSITK